MISATIDTSVYVRALHLGGPSALLLGYARAGERRIDLSAAILEETIRILREKFQWNGYMLQDARAKAAASRGFRLTDPDAVDHPGRPS